MSNTRSILQFLKPTRKSSIYLIAGLVCMIWLLATPPGVLGKADAIGYAVCHRIDTRSFHIGEIQLPLCARCTGQYLGAIIGLVFLGIFGRRMSGTPPKRVISLMILLILFYAVDGLNSYLYLPPFLKIFPGMPHLYQPSNTLRLFTGTGMGIVIAIVLYPAFWGSILVNPDPRPAVSNLRISVIIMILGITVDLLILTGSKFVLFPAALISTGGVLLLLTMVYTILWMRILHKENQFTRLSQITLYAMAGFIITIIQIGLFDLVRFIITGTWNGLIF